jgi:hypothetical protein
MAQYAKEVAGKLNASGGKMTTMEAMGGGDASKRFDRKFSPSEWPTSVPVPAMPMPVKLQYRHDSGLGQSEK